MRSAAALLALVLLGAGCRSERPVPPPDPADVEALVAAHLADARAEAAGGGRARPALAPARLDRLARHPAEAAALWAAVAAALDAERLGVTPSGPPTDSTRSDEAP